MAKPAAVGPVPRRLRARSKYDPHQSISEQMRRIGQALRGQHPDLIVSDEAKAVYLDYVTAKALGQDLSRFRPAKDRGENFCEMTVLDEAPVQTIGYVDAKLIGDDIDGLLNNVQTAAETGSG